jgi:hypothetical protein
MGNRCLRLIGWLTTILRLLPVLAGRSILRLLAILRLLTIDGLLAIRPLLRIRLLLAVRPLLRIWLLLRVRLRLILSRSWGRILTRLRLRILASLGIGGRGLPRRGVLREHRRSGE